MIYSVVMAGGRGERFWPLSRTDRPKQFLKLTSEKTMLEETIARVKPKTPIDNIRIVTGQSMLPLIKEQIDYLTDKHILTEPFGRNTCLAIGLAAVHLLKEDPKAVMVVLSADHLISPREKLLQIIDNACAIASQENYLITIGVVPNRPETGYGYVKMGDLYKKEGETNIYHVSAFTEKPKLVVAQEYYYSRKYLWNSGMFVWSAEVILNNIEKCQPEMGQLLREYSEHIGTDKELSARENLYKSAISISIDYAVLENADDVLVVKADLLWDDVGSWNALERFKDKDFDNNVLVGETALMDSYETTIYNDDDGIICALGISDLVIVRSSGITLVAHKTKLTEIKDFIAKLSEDEKTKKYL